MPARHGDPGIGIPRSRCSLGMTTPLPASPLSPSSVFRLPSPVSRLPSPSVYGFTARNTIACAPNDSATFRVSALELPAK